MSLPSFDPNTLDPSSAFSLLGPTLLTGATGAPVFHGVAMLITACTVLIALFWADGLDEIPRPVIWVGLFLLPFWTLMAGFLVPRLMRADRPLTAIMAGGFCALAAGFYSIVLAGLF